MPEEISNRIHE